MPIGKLASSRAPRAVPRGAWLFLTLLFALLVGMVEVSLTGTAAQASVPGYASAPLAPQAVLYDQMDNGTNFYISSQENPPAEAAFSTQTADDFTVPGGSTWSVESVVVFGSTNTFTQPVYFNVYFYQLSGILPGAPVYTATAQSYTVLHPTPASPVTGVYTVSLGTPANLGVGTYFVSVQAYLTRTSSNEQWYWQDRSVQSGNKAAWRNPGGGFSGTGCTDWGVRATCTPGQGSDPDQIFKLNGTAVVASSTPTGSTTPVSSTATSAATATSSSQATSTACPIQFVDAGPDTPFYSFIRCLACRNVLGGYSGEQNCPEGSPCFKPNDNITRGQIAKIVSNAAGYNDVIPGSQQSFADVPSYNPFWLFIERVHDHGAISGYTCDGTNGEPTSGACYRPGNNLTRGQLAKIATSVAGYSETPSGQTFNDVPTDSPFYVYIERAAMHNIISGYECGRPGEPCPGAYFRPGVNVTRGQAAKIIAGTFFPNCQTPARR